MRELFKLCTKHSFLYFLRLIEGGQKRWKGTVLMCLGQIEKFPDNFKPGIMCMLPSVFDLFLPKIRHVVRKGGKGTVLMCLGQIGKIP